MTTKPATVMTGRTSHPVSRSSTTDANVAGVSPVSRDSRLTRNTSPPIVVGRTLETNCPARLCRTSSDSRAGISSAVSTFCQRTADRTMPTSVSSAEAPSQAAVPAVHSGSRSPGRNDGTWATSTASIATLTSTRARSETACLCLTACSPLVQTAADPIARRRGPPVGGSGERRVTAMPHRSAWNASVVRVDN